MSWADNYIEKLLRGESIQFRPRGNSMTPKIKSGQLVSVDPVNRDIVVGDIVLCKVSGNQYLHIVNAIDKDRFQIKNAHGRINGWTRTIYGILTKVEP